MLNVKYEGIYLFFKNDRNKILNEIMLTLENDENADWVFPNALPFSL